MNKNQILPLFFFILSSILFFGIALPLSGDSPGMFNFPPGEFIFRGVHDFDVDEKSSDSPGEPGKWLNEIVKPIIRSYVVVVKESTLSKPEWEDVVEILSDKYRASVFSYESSVWEIQGDLSDYKPWYAAFVTEPLDAGPSFVSTVWQLSRALDEDIYGDFIWGIITGYDAADALRLATGPGSFEVRTVVGGTMSCDLDYFPHGIATDEATYNHIKIKSFNGTVIDTVDADLCPTDRTEFLVNHVNSDTVDIFITSGHANHNEWQLHYPYPSEEGFFRSWDGQVYGDPKSGPDIDINSINPKIYFGLGNCYIGKIANMNSMSPAWIHTGGAHLFTGYVQHESSNHHQHGGTKAFFCRQANHTWPEAFFLGNQALVFDIENETPGADPPDKDWSALYGDPALVARVAPLGVTKSLLYYDELNIKAGTVVDTIMVQITMNTEGCPGYNGKWGNRHPIVLFPFRINDPHVIWTDAYRSVVTDNFALLYIWKQGDDPLYEGETRTVVFTASIPDTAYVEIVGASTDKRLIDHNGDSIELTVKWRYLNTINSVPYNFKITSAIGPVPGEGYLIRTSSHEDIQPGLYSENFSFDIPPVPNDHFLRCGARIKPFPRYGNYSHLKRGNYIISE